MPRRKILFLSSWFPSRAHLFAGNFVEKHAKAAALFHDVEVLYCVGMEDLDVPYSKEVYSEGNLKVLIFYYSKSKNPVLRPLQRWQAYRKAVVNITPPDLIHANVMDTSMIFAVWCKRFFRVPLVFTEHWTALQSENHHKLSLAKKNMVKWIAHQADLLFPVSENLAQGLRKLGITTPMSIIPNVVNTKKFIPKVPQQKEFLFLHLSSLVPRKRADIIVLAAIELHKKSTRPLRLHIGGDGTPEFLEKLISEHHAESYIKIIPPLSETEVVDIMQESNAFVLFSENETQGVVLLEAISCGVPVITTNVGGVGEFVNTSNGIFVEDTLESLVEGMQDMLEKSSAYDSQKMHESIQCKYAPEVIGKAFAKVYEKLWS